MIPGFLNGWPHQKMAAQMMGFLKQTVEVLKRHTGHVGRTAWRSETPRAFQVSEAQEMQQGFTAEVVHEQEAEQQQEQEEEQAGIRFAERSIFETRYLGSVF